MVGASRMSTPLLLASVPSAAARAWTRAGSQVAPSADGLGRLEAGLRSSMVVPRTPAGPSETTMGRRPMAGAGRVRQLSAPVSRRTLSSGASAASRPRSPLIVVMVMSSYAVCRCWSPLVRASGRGLEVQDHVLDLGRVGAGVGVRVGLAGPAGVGPGAELCPGRAVQQGDHRHLGGLDALQGVKRGLLGGRAVAADVLAEGGLGLRVV